MRFSRESIAKAFKLLNYTHEVQNQVQSTLQLKIILQLKSNHTNK